MISFKKRTKREVDETNYLNVNDELLGFLESRLLLVGKDSGKIVVGFAEVLLSGGGKSGSVLLLAERKSKATRQRESKRSAREVRGDANEPGA